ncbi:nucleotide exchange factor GrpE [Sphingosinicella terrae]|jgi:molecular chaperone GrpE|uniref:nucleotide exchange factor GrpE n=1 Tax=Sphingosinicella terrae TaxID=2172047 RepID=UPI000E0CDD02|nr:nucleotide exchange factor GrpE [Sphingosinicella terrae]
MNEDANTEARDENEAAESAEGGELNLDRLSELEKELEEVRQHVLYAQAETQNVRRRLEQEKVNAANYASTGFARDMLSVKDNLERALSAIPDDLREDERMKGLVTGIEATGRELESVFQRHGIARIEAMGRKLDPHLHQAMIEVPDDKSEPGTIIQEMQAGYQIKDRLLRPALVGVSRKP